MITNLIQTRFTHIRFTNAIAGDLSDRSPTQIIFVLGYTRPLYGVRLQISGADGPLSGTRLYV